MGFHGRQPELQRKLLDRLIERLPEYSEQKEALHKRLGENRRAVENKLSALSLKLDEDKGLLRRFREFKADFELVNTPEVAALFEELDLAREKLGVLNTARHEFAQLRAAIEETTAFDVVEVNNRLLDGKSESVRTWWEAEISPRLRVVEIGDSLSAMRAQVQARLDEKSAILDALIKVEEAVAANKEATLRERTQASPQDTLVRGKREQSKKRFEAASRKRSEYNALLEELRTLLNGRKQISRELEQTQDLISGARAASRDSMMARINEFQTAGLKVSIAFGSGKDRGTVIEYMRDKGFLSGPAFGQYKKSQFAERCCAMVRPTQIARAVLDEDISPLTSEGRALDSDGSLVREEAERLVNHFHPFVDDTDADVEVVDQEKLSRVLILEEQRWDDELRILLNDQPVDKLSPGQRSSAMLPIVALSETVPLIIDQPEDNLDNRMVGTVFTRILADLKEHRQIIVATHNPNIVVGGDAEQVIVLEATEARRAKVQLMGSIDVPAVIESVISIMEGGADAFRARERRYYHFLQA